MNTETEELRRSAHSVAEMLYEGQIGGECYYGGHHTCFVRQGRKPLALYKVEEMCERCAAAWHAVMAATLLDSLVIGQRFINGQPVEPPRGRSRPLVIETDETLTPSASPSPKRKGKKAGKATKAGKAAKAGKATEPIESGAFPVKPATGGKYGEYADEDKTTILAAYVKLKKRAEKMAFLGKYRLKAWHLSGWRNRHKGIKKAPKESKTKAPKTAKVAKAKAAKTSDEPALFPCEKCGRGFTQRNWKTMHERFCKG